MRNSRDLAGGRAAWALDPRLSAIALVGVVAALMAPRGTAAVFLVLAAFPIAALHLDRAYRELWPLPPLTLVIAAFTAYCAVNSVWSVNRLEAGGKVLFLAAIAAVGHAAVIGLAHLDGVWRRHLVRAILVGVAIGALLLLIEVWTGQSLKRLLFNFVPATRLDPKHMVLVDGRVTAIGPHVLNRSFAVLCFMLWPVLFLVRTRLPGPTALVAALALIAVTALGVFRSEHETSMLALMFSGVACLGMMALPRLMRPLIVAGWVVATILVIPIAVASYSAGLHQAKWIPETGRSRIILWSVTANKVLEAPVLGVGVAATKDLDELAKPAAAQPQDHSYPLRTGRHSHNIFMQTWYELGAVGAVLLLTAGLLLLRALARLPEALQPYAWASFVAAVLIGAFSWGLWQTWFLAAFGIWMLLLALAAAVAREAATVTPR